MCTVAGPWGPPPGPMGATFSTVSNCSRHRPRYSIVGNDSVRDSVRLNIPSSRLHAVVAATWLRESGTRLAVVASAALAPAAVCCAHRADTVVAAGLLARLGPACGLRLRLRLSSLLPSLHGVGAVAATAPANASGIGVASRGVSSVGSVADPGGMQPTG
jgi:hypothetical protein